MTITRKSAIGCSSCHRSWHFMTGKHPDDSKSLVAGDACPYADSSPTIRVNVFRRFLTADLMICNQAYKRQQGGWIFHANNGQVIWFDASRFTPSKIFTHPATHGLSGCLV